MAEVFGEEFPQRGDGLGPAPLALLSRQPDDLAGRPKRQCKFNGFIQNPADADIGVAAFKTYAVKAGAAQHLAHHVLTRHGEGPGTAMHLGCFRMGNDGHDVLHDPFSFIDPGIILAAAPNDHGEFSVRLQGAANIAQRRTGQVEEHGAEARENVIIGTSQIIDLHIGEQK